MIRKWTPICTWCGKSWPPYTNEKDTPDAHPEALEHMRHCQKNPLVAENAALRAKVERCKVITEGATLDYGYANGWKKTPVLVQECKSKGHKPSDTSVKAFGHDNIVFCGECRYKYKYDSS